MKTDKELYYIARQLERLGLGRLPPLDPRADCDAPLRVTQEELDQIVALRDAAIERYKPRVPRVTRRWMAVDVRDGGPACSHESRDLVEAFVSNHEGYYLAQAVLTEVMG